MLRRKVIYKAIDQDDIDQLSYALSIGLNPVDSTEDQDERYEYQYANYSYLMYVVSKQKVDVVRLFMDDLSDNPQKLNEVRVSQTHWSDETFLNDYVRTSSLIMACIKNNHAIVKLLLENGFSPDGFNIVDGWNKNKTSVIYTAVERSSYEIVEELVKHGCKLNVGHRQTTPYDIARRLERNDVVQLFEANMDNN